MSLVVVNKTNNADPTDASSYTSASWVPVPGRLYLLWVSAVHDVSVLPTVSVAGNGITWTQVVSTSHLNAFATTIGHLVSLYVGVADLSSTTGSITFTTNATTSCAWSLDEWSSSLGSVPYVPQSVAGGISTSGAATVTLPSVLLPGSASTGALEHAGSGSSTVGAGYTQLAQVFADTNHNLLDEYRYDGAQIINATQGGSGTGWLMVGAEVAEPASGWGIPLN